MEGACIGTAPSTTSGHAKSVARARSDHNAPVHERYVEFHFSSIGDINLVSFVDLTERKRAEIALRESEGECDGRDSQRELRRRRLHERWQEQCLDFDGQITATQRASSPILDCAALRNWSVPENHDKRSE